MMSDRYLYAADKPWHLRLFGEQADNWSGMWCYAEDTADLRNQVLCNGPFKYIFFHHWSERVPSDILRHNECIGFHMSALPYGRGGSPLQNLIEIGERQTFVTAFRLTDELDAGPIYSQSEMSLFGLAEEIYLRAAQISIDMMLGMVATDKLRSRSQRAPYPDEKAFRRRTPEQSEIDAGKRLGQLFEHMRMLDAEGYPRAFLRYGGNRYEFSRPALRDGRIEADVKIMEDG